jgi:hypothetical protein
MQSPPQPSPAQSEPEFAAFLAIDWADQETIYPVHPKTLNDYRAAWRPSGSKSDPGDTHLLWEILTTHRHQLRRLDPDTPSFRLLQSLVETVASWWTNAPSSATACGTAPRFTSPRWCAGLRI